MIYYAHSLQKYDTPEETAEIKAFNIVIKRLEQYKNRIMFIGKTKKQRLQRQYILEDFQIVSIDMI